MTIAPKRPLFSAFVIAAISLASPLLSSSARANLVTNGGFEAGATVIVPGIGGTAVGGGDTSWTDGSMAGWDVGPANGSVNAIATNTNPFYGTISATGPGNGADAVPVTGVFGAGGGGPHSGVLAAVFPNGMPYDGYISQAISGLVAGEWYRVGFWISNQLGDVSNNSNSLAVSWGGNIDTLHGSVLTGDSVKWGPSVLTVPLGWQYQYFDVKADASTERLNFIAGNAAAGNLIDDVSVVAVPEVSSFGMLTGLGLLAFGTAARIRRRSVATA